MDLKKTFFHTWYLFELMAVLAFGTIVGELLGRFVNHDRPFCLILITALAVETVVALYFSRQAKKDHAKFLSDK